MLLLVEICLVFCLIAQKTESKLIVRVIDRDDILPSLLDYEDERTNNSEEPKLDDGFKPHNKKPSRTKHAVVHYGRHIYHLDNFKDLRNLRSKKNKDYVSYDYVDINELFRKDKKKVPWYREKLDDKLLLKAAEKIKSKCKVQRGKECKENMRKFNEILRKGKQKYPESVEKYIKHKMPIGNLKRFKIVDSGKQSKAYAMDKPAKRKPFGYTKSAKPKRAKKETVRNKKKRHSSRGTSSEDKKHWSSNESKENLSKKKKKKFTETKRENKKSFSAEKHSISSEMNNWDFGSNSIEESLNKMKKKKKTELTKRKTFTNDEMYLQGGRLVEPNAEIQENDFRRRRLPQFLPKRYHWDPSEIHDLGYFWFNGPKGRYAHPTTLLDRK